MKWRGSCFLIKGQARFPCDDVDPEGATHTFDSQDVLGMAVCCDSLVSGVFVDKAIFPSCRVLHQR